MRDLIDSLKNLKGFRTYTDEDGKFHMTTISEEKELEMKQGKVCNDCGKRDKWLRTAPDGKSICDSCFKLHWCEQGIDGEIKEITESCPFCGTEQKLKDDGGKCDCGAYYVGGFDYDSPGWYEFRFFKEK